MREPGKKPSFTDAWRNVKVFVSYYKPYKVLAAADLVSILAQSGLTILLPMVVYRVFNNYLPQMEFRIGHGTTTLQSVCVDTGIGLHDGQPQTADYLSGEEDGVIGLDLLERFKRVILNLKEMYMEAVTE